MLVLSVSELPGTGVPLSLQSRSTAYTNKYKHTVLIQRHILKTANLPRPPSAPTKKVYHYGYTIIVIVHKVEAGMPHIH